MTVNTIASQDINHAMSNEYVEGIAIFDKKVVLFVVQENLVAILHAYGIPNEVKSDIDLIPSALMDFKRGDEDYFMVEYVQEDKP